MLKKELWVGKNYMRREGGGGGGVGKIVILSPSTSTEIPNHKTSTKNKQTNKQTNNTVNKLLDGAS